MGATILQKAIICSSFAPFCLSSSQIACLASSSTWAFHDGQLEVFGTLRFGEVLVDLEPALGQLQCENGVAQRDFRPPGLQHIGSLVCLGDLAPIFSRGEV